MIKMEILKVEIEGKEYEVGVNGVVSIKEEDYRGGIEIVVYGHVGKKIKEIAAKVTQ